MLTLENLVIRQDDFELRADWGLPAGRRVALIGPSGAGKSTLLSALGGFIAPSAGRICWQGRDLAGVPPARRPLAMLFQDGNLFPHLTAEANVALALAPRARPDAQARARARAALDRVGLAGLEGRRPAALSGGQQSRVALARALLQDRPILALDEPFAALGPALKAEMLELVAELLDETGASLLMVSHDPEDALRIAQDVVVVAEGEAAPPRPTRALLDDPPPVLARYLGDGPRR